MSHRLTDRIAAMIEEYVTDLAGADDVTWDFTLAQQAAGPVGLIFVFMPSGVIGETLQTNAVMSNPAAASATDLQSTLRQMLDGLRTARSEHLAKAVQPVQVSAAGSG